MPSSSLKAINVWPRPAAGPQLWEWGRIEEGGEGDTTKEWNPDRAAKSLAFLKEEEQADEDNRVDSGPLTKVKAKKAKLNVSDKDSPYALIDKYFPERESYFYQNKDKFVEEYRGQETKTDIGNISPSEVTAQLRYYGSANDGEVGEAEGWKAFTNYSRWPS